MVTVITLLQAALLVLGAMAHRPPVDGLVVMLTPSGGRFVVLGDPVLLLLAVTNSGDEPATFNVPNMRRHFPVSVRVQIAAPQQDFVELKHPDIHIGGDKQGIGYVPPTITLGPGESAEFPVLLHYDFPSAAEWRWLFPEPGDYQIRVTFTHWASGRRMRAPPTIVTIVAPDNEADRLAWSELSNMHRPWQLCGPWYSSVDTFTIEIKRFRERHRESRYFKFTEMGRLYSALRSVQPNDQQCLAIYDELTALIARAKEENWPPGWIAVAEQLEARMFPYTRGKRLRPPSPYDLPTSSPTEEIPPD